MESWQGVSILWFPASSPVLRWQLEETILKNCKDTITKCYTSGQGPGQLWKYLALILPLQWTSQVNHSASQPWFPSLSTGPRGHRSSFCSSGVSWLQITEPMSSGRSLACFVCWIYKIVMFGDTCFPGKWMKWQQRDEHSPSSTEDKAKCTFTYYFSNIAFSRDWCPHITNFINILKQMDFHIFYDLK